MSEKLISDTIKNDSPCVCLAHDWRSAVVDLFFHASGAPLDDLAECACGDSGNLRDWGRGRERHGTCFAAVEGRLWEGRARKGLRRASWHLAWRRCERVDVLFVTRAVRLARLRKG